MRTTDRQLLISIARVACGDAGTEPLGDLAGPSTGWSSLLPRFEQEGLDGVLYDCLTREGTVAAVPPEVWHRLQRRHAHRLLDYQIKLRALEELLALAGRKGIDLLVLQGMAIAGTLYPDGVRPLSDIDLLVRRESLDEAETLLLRLGYTRVSRFPPVYARDGVCVDLHQQLAYLSRTDPADNPLRVHEAPLWAAAVRRPFGAEQALTLSPVDQIVILSAHLQKHSFSRLIWFVDLGRLFNQLAGPAPFETVQARAAALHLEQPLYYVCLYLREVLRLPLCQPHSWPAPSQSWAERRLASWLAMDRRIDGMGDLLYLLSIGGLSARWRFLRSTILPDTEMMREQVRSSSPFSLAWGYVNRLARLTWQAARLSFRLLRNGVVINR